MRVLVDTSVWVNYLHKGDKTLQALLENGEIAQHPMVIGELACGNLKNRTEILSLLGKLPLALQAADEEVFQLIDRYRLYGKGLGWIDLHLLASCLLSGLLLWSQDKALQSIAHTLCLDFE